MSDRLCRIVEDELDKIADKGLTTSNIDNAYKLSKIKYYLTTTDAMEDYDNGSSYGRHSANSHYSRDNMYSNDSYDRYSQAKYDYRHSRSSGDHRAIMDNLDIYMSEMSDRLTEMMKDADTPEEKDMIKRYINKIKTA